MDEYTFEDCLGSGEHGGEVFYGPSSTGATSYVMCEAHRAERMERTMAIRQRYPDSDVAPSWFDPTYAGERWNDDY